MSPTITDYMAKNYRELGGSVFTYFLKEGSVEVITFADLLRRGAAYAEFYRKLGAGAGDSIIIILQHSPDLLYAFVGALLAGAIPSFMPFPSHKQDPERYWSSHQKLFQRIGTRVLVTYDDNLPALRGHIEGNLIHVVTPTDVAAKSLSLEPEFETVDPEAVAFLQHTSGTTGLKKGIALSHRAVVNQVQSYAGALGLTGQDRIASWLPLYHDMGLIACFVQPLLLGLPVVMMDPFEWVYRPVMLLEAIESYRATFVWLPNFSFQHLAQTNDAKRRGDLTSVKAFINCSEPCKPETLAKFLETFATWGARAEQLQACYAMAETVFAVTQTRLHVPLTSRQIGSETPRSGECESAPSDSPSPVFLSVGQPLPNLQVKVVDGLRQPVRDGTVGEVAIAGDCIFSGYYRQPDETRQVLHGEWYYSGDLGFVADGNLYITGRKKDLIIVNGRNYYAHHLEDVANKVEGVKKGRVAAIGIYDDSVGSETIVIIAETPVTSPDQRQAMARAIKTEVLRELDAYLADVFLVARDWIVKTTSGKISREENKKKYLEEKGLRAGPGRKAA